MAGCDVVVMSSAPRLEEDQRKARAEGKGETRQQSAVGTLAFAPDPVGFQKRVTAALSGLPLAWC